MHVTHAVFTVQSDVFMSSQSPVKFPQILRKQISNSVLLLSNFPAMNFEHLILLTSHLSSATCPLKMPLEFFRLSLTEKTLSSKGTDCFTTVGIIMTCKQIIEYNMKLS